MHVGNATNDAFAFELFQLLVSLGRIKKVLVLRGFNQKLEGRINQDTFFWEGVMRRIKVVGD